MSWNHNLAYRPWLLQQVPPRCARALDAGCGDGALTFALAPLSHLVTGIDLDPALLPPGTPAITFIAGDILTHPFAHPFDFVATVATLHHLPLAAGLTRLRMLVAPNGVLAIIGIYRLSTPRELFLAIPARFISTMRRLWQGPAPMRAKQAAPAETFASIEAAVRATLPGATIQRRFFFRYTIRWQAPP